MTSTTLLKRLIAHKYNGSMKQHLIDHHKEKIKHHYLEENTTIIDKATTRRQLFIKEALIINKKKPSIKKQYSCFSQVIMLHDGALIITKIVLAVSKTSHPKCYNPSV